MRSPAIPTLTHRLPADAAAAVDLTLPLTADERTRSRHRFETVDGQAVYLHLPRGSVLRDGDRLQSEDGLVARILAKAEPVLTVTAPSPLELLQAAYHLGNRHVSLEITATYLRLSPDPVLQDLLRHRGLHVTEELQPFQPETGAYKEAGHSHSSQNSC